MKTVKQTQSALQKQKRTAEAMRLKFSLIFIILAICSDSILGIDYGEALTKSILFFEGQRSGSLPEDQRMKWRGDSAEGDGSELNVDLSGGYYDAGDNIKFGFPMAFTTTMLAWSVVEFGDSMPSRELRNALVAVRWGTDYLLKTIAHPNKIFVQVGDPNSDHGCWERPEDMDTSRKAYQISAPETASDIAGEIAAALAASSIAFRHSDPSYSQTLIRNAITVFDYADTYRGAYSNNKEISDGACPFYCDFDGYQDELLWGAAWLKRATQNDSYLNYIEENARTLGADENSYEFGWDDKHAGINVLVSEEFLYGSVETLESYKLSADSFMCTLIPDSSSSSLQIQRTPGGLIYKPGGSNLQHVTSIAFLLLAYANYLSKSSNAVDCYGSRFRADELRDQAKKQIDYLLGENPLSMSYMVGFTERFPNYIHHRGSSSPSIHDHPEKIGCEEGSFYFNSNNPNPNLLVGAVVGGPGMEDEYNDSRVDFKKSEPATYINAPLVGVLAYFAANVE